MRLVVLSVVGGLLAGCTSGSVSPPRDQILYEMPREPAVPPAPPVVSQNVGQDDFAGRIERVLDGAGSADASGALVPVPQVPEGTAGGTPIDDDRLNLGEYTLEQQRIDADIAERQLEAARQQLVIVQPDGSVPQTAPGVNIALFAQQTTHAVGEKRYSRPITAALNRGGACRRMSSADEAQRVFLAEGGPERDRRGLDPDGDGFACGWDPEPFRRLGR